METILIIMVAGWGVISLFCILNLFSALEQEKWQRNHFEREAEKWYRQSVIYLDAWERDSKILTDQLFKEIQKRS